MTAAQRNRERIPEMKSAMSKGAWKLTPEQLRHLLLNQSLCAILHRETMLDVLICKMGHEEYQEFLLTLTDKFAVNELA